MHEPTDPHPPMPERAGARPAPLSAQERAVLEALCARPDKVHSRTELARAAGLGNGRGRRVDALLVGVRRAVGDDALVNVRNRGWRIVPGAAFPAELEMAR